MPRADDTAGATAPLHFDRASTMAEPVARDEAHYTLEVMSLEKRGPGRGPGFGELWQMDYGFEPKEAPPSALAEEDVADATAAAEASLLAEQDRAGGAPQLAGPPPQLKGPEGSPVQLPGSLVALAARLDQMELALSGRIDQVSSRIEGLSIRMAVAPGGSDDRQAPSAMVPKASARPEAPKPGAPRRREAGKAPSFPELRQARDASGALEGEASTEGRSWSSPENEEEGPGGAPAADSWRFLLLTAAFLASALSGGAAFARIRTAPKAPVPLSEEDLVVRQTAGFGAYVRAEQAALLAADMRNPALGALERVSGIQALPGGR